MRFARSVAAALAITAAAPHALGAAPASMAIVSFMSGSMAQRHAVADVAGLRVLAELRSAGALVVEGPRNRIARLRGHPMVSEIEDDRPLRYLDATSVWATRVGVVQHAVAGGPFRAPGGAVLDGSGVGVAIVDTGADATHPDLTGRIASNVKVAVGRDFGPGSNTDATSGHGTVVSGVVAGDGTASGRTFRGAAPGATLHVFSAGEVLSVVSASQALDMIYTKYDTFEPRIRIVNNSWGNPAGSAYRPEGVIERIVGKLVQDKGVSVVWAAGNDGGDGTADMTSAYCKDPTPGVICAANYDDDESGNRDHQLDPSSSRGVAGHPESYPDVAAPGAFITSTMKPTSGALYGSFIFPDPAWPPYYGDAGGTSLAAPHISGTAALLYQADPSLTPAAVEDALLDTAHGFASGGAYEPDPQNAGGMTSFDKGAGLVDAPRALEAVGIVGDGAASPTLLASGDGGDYRLWGAADIEGMRASPGAGAIAYDMTVRDVADRPQTEMALRLFANVDGVARRTDVILRPDGTVAPKPAESPDDPATAEASSATVTQNTVSIVVPYAELGSPVPGAPVHNVWGASYIRTVQDVAPGPPPPTTGLDLVVRPAYAPPFTIA